MELQEALDKIAELENENKTLKDSNTDITRNFENYRTKAEDEKKDLSTKLDLSNKNYETFKGEVDTKEQIRKESFLSKLIEEKSRGDKSLAEKIAYEYKNFNLPEDTEDDIKARVEKASSIHIKGDQNPSPNPTGDGQQLPDGGAKKEDMSGEAQGIYDFMTARR